MLVDVAEPGSSVHSRQAVGEALLDLFGRSVAARLSRQHFCVGAGGCLVESGVDQPLAFEHGDGQVGVLAGDGRQGGEGVDQCGAAAYLFIDVARDGLQQMGERGRRRGRAQHRRIQGVRVEQGHFDEAGGR